MIPSIPHQLAANGLPSVWRQVSIRINEHAAARTPEHTPQNMARGNRRITVPDQNKGHKHEDVVYSRAIWYRIGEVSTIDSKNTHEQQGERASQNVYQSRFGRDTLCIPVLDGIWYRHAHCEQKTRKNKVGQSGEVFSVFCMQQPVRHIVYAPEIIDKYHHKHGDGSEHVDGRIPAGEVDVGLILVHGKKHLCGLLP